MVSVGPTPRYGDCVKPTAVLLLSCPDQTGIVATVADFVWRNGGNIVHAEQHTDTVAGMFFQRVEFELDGFAFPREKLAFAFQPIADRFGMDVQIRFSDDLPEWPFWPRRRRIAWWTYSPAGKLAN